MYKNKKHFINLCHHNKDFSTECVWNFFATSHGKSPCDGLGGTTKCLTAKASLQRPVGNQILTANEMYQFCKDSITGIKFMQITSQQMADVRVYLNERFELAKTIPGTRGFHQYVPLENLTIGCRRVSDDADFDLKFEFNSNSNKGFQDIRISNFVLCTYDDRQWIGMVCDTDSEIDEMKIKFMHPQYPSRSYNWPRRDVFCWVPTVKIITIISAPSVTSSGARQYQISSEIF